MIEFKNWPKFWAPGYIWTIGLDWDVSCWWRVYSHDYYDGDWYSYRLGPLYFGRYV